MTSYKNYWKNYFNFSGLASRKDMWIVLLFNAIIIGVLNRVVPTLASIYSILILIPNISISIRRLRDGGHSAMPLIVVYVLDFIGLLLIGLNYLFSWIPVVGWFSTFLLVWLPSIVVFFASLYLFILLYCQGSKQNRGFNNYNPNNYNQYNNNGY